MNVIPFLYKNSSNITFFTAENFILKSTGKIIKELDTVTNMYKLRGFNVDVYHGDK